MIRPSHCPYCSTRVRSMRPYKTHTPPDERDESTTPIAVIDGWEMPDPQDIPSFEIEDCQQLSPCGHIFRDADLIAFEAGRISGYELGDRVDNPGDT